jgi:NAD(P)H dehydrogenase (quinone)
MKIGVSGASGHLGRAVVSELLQRPGGHEVVAITRTPETVSGLAQVRFGDYNRPESLREAYAGLDRLLIITTVDPEPGKRGAQHVAAIDAAAQASPRRACWGAEISSGLKTCTRTDLLPVWRAA